MRNILVGLLILGSAQTALSEAPPKKLKVVVDTVAFNNFRVQTIPGKELFEKLKTSKNPEDRELVILINDLLWDVMNSHIAAWRADAKIDQGKLKRDGFMIVEAWAYRFGQHLRGTKRKESKRFISEIVLSKSAPQEIAQRLDAMADVILLASEKDLPGELLDALRGERSNLLPNDVPSP